MDLDNDALLRLNRRGIFFGPTESTKDFLLRAETLPSKSNPSTLLEKKFGCAPDWIDVRTHSKGLSPWEGAATWIEESDAGRTCWVQLKDSFLTRLYAKDEVIAHEMVHAVRFMFDENRFAEILAYQTSSSRFRRYFGPLFTHSKESKWLVAMIAISWFIYTAEVVFDLRFFGESVLFAPLLVIGLASLRLRRSQTLFSSALRNLEKAIRAAPLPLALRLTDKESEFFAHSIPEEIRAFAISEQEKSLRWRQLYISYF